MTNVIEALDSNALALDGKDELFLARDFDAELFILDEDSITEEVDFFNELTETIPYILYKNREEQNDLLNSSPIKCFSATLSPLELRDAVKEIGKSRGMNG